ncbi:fungal hydrophobin [Trametes versicolor FP-101664 SS1]|uniref:fungal hydrophobin n=1 Tax=Trametes versicolor (strain FP-101664) TaxID=717944 RepID=UPI00046245D2|nr:fungal hydrophobin [Trametes versicolor FP-101664 SS1]EIW61062.1 fungal hydrophobin [Trametes versicolor FP-101664 SS1]
MFSRAVALTISALPLLAAATPLEARNSGSCSTGPVQCCQSTETAGSTAGSALLGSLGIVVQDVNVLVGVTCSPITVVGVGSGGSCSAQTVCCSDNSHGGLVSIGCAPVTV